MLLANETVGSLRAGDEIGFDVDLHRTFGEIATYNGRKEPVVGGGGGGGGCCCGGGGGGGGRHEKSGQETAVLGKHSLHRLRFVVPVAVGSTGWCSFTL